MASHTPDSNTTSQLPRPSSASTTTSTSNPSNTSPNPNLSSIPSPNLNLGSSPSISAQASSSSNLAAAQPTTSGSSTPTATPHRIQQQSVSSPRRQAQSLTSHHSRLPSGSAASYLATPSSSSVASSLYIPHRRISASSQGPIRSWSPSNNITYTPASNSNYDVSNQRSSASEAGSSTASSRSATPRSVRHAAGLRYAPAQSSSSLYDTQQASTDWQTTGGTSVRDSFSSSNNSNSLGHFSHPNFNHSISSSRVPDSSSNMFTPESFQSATFEENSIISFSWLISDLKALRDEVELSPLPSEGGRSVSAGAGKSEVWTKQPRFGSGNWMVDLGTHTDDAEQDAEQREQTDQANENETNQNQQAEDAQSSEQENATSNGVKDDSQKPARKPTVLSVYLTSVNPSATSSLTHIMIGLKPLSNSASSHMTAKSWVYQHFSTFSFSREHDFLEHSLPTLSSLLLNDQIRTQDSVQLVIQIACGNGLVGEILSSAQSELSKKQLDDSIPNSSNEMIPIFDSKNITFPFALPDVETVPKSMVESLKGLLDCKLTSDVRILVRERGIVRPSQQSTSEEDDVAYLVEPFPIGSPLPSWFQPEVHGDEDGRPREVFRHRTLWAHSSILKSRSDYFKTMLESEFIESQEQEVEDDGMSNEHRTWTTSIDQRSLQPSLTRSEGLFSGRKVKTLRISDSDFGTVYWLLRYLYLNEIRFEQLEDVKTSGIDFEDLEVGNGKSEVCWDWKTLEELELRSKSQDEEGEGEGEEVNEIESNGREIDQVGVNNLLEHRHHQHRHQSSSQRDFGLSNHDRRASSRSLSSRTSLTSIQASASGNPSNNGENSSNDSQLQANPSPAQNQQGQGSNPESTFDSFNRPLTFNDATNQDPHPHPTDYAYGAFSLAIYRLSHRYGQNDLAQLAKKHLLNNLNAKNAFQTLLATSLYKEVQLGVRAWVYDNWSLVSSTEEFGACLVEISAGAWGPEAGATLQSFMRLLRSPARR